MNAKHGKRVMDCITLKISMTPEEIQGVLVDLDSMRRRGAREWDVETTAFITALTEAAKPRTGRILGVA
jgi:hypothetical protein